MRLLMLMAALVLVACVHQPLSTPSKRPETVVDKPRQELRDALVPAMMNVGYTLKTANDYQLVFEREIPPSFTAAMLSSRYDNSPVSRLVFTMAPVDPARTRLYVESWTRLTADDQALQRDLDSIAGSGIPAFAAKAQAAASPEFNDVRIGIVTGQTRFQGSRTTFVQTCGITGVTPGSVAEAAGIRVGDKIVRIDGDECGDGGVASLRKRRDWERGRTMIFDLDRQGAPMQVRVTPAGDG
jgi:hypothetical protein